MGRPPAHVRLGRGSHRLSARERRGGDTLLDDWADKCSLWTPPRYRANCSSTRPPSMTAPACLATLDIIPSDELGLRPSGDSGTRSTTSRPPETSRRRGSPQRTSTVVAAGSLPLVRPKPRSWLVTECGTVGLSAASLPSDSHAAPGTHFDLGCLESRLRHYPDQYLAANILKGIRLDGDVELQSVWVPLLTSLPSGHASVGEELRRLRPLGWYSSAPTSPSGPCTSAARERRRESLKPDRFRRTTEGNGPRAPTFVAPGLQAISIRESFRIYRMPQHFLRDVVPNSRLAPRPRSSPPPARGAQTAASCRRARHRHLRSRRPPAQPAYLRLRGRRRRLL